MTDQTQPLNSDGIVDQPLAAGAVLKEAYRVTALLSDTPAMRMYRVTLLQSEQCARCGDRLQPGDQFCDSCGAKIEEQTALLQETPAAAPAGAALLADLSAEADDDVSALPAVQDVFVGDNARYAILPDTSGTLSFDTLISEQGTTLNEVDALQIGITMARALAFLHRNGLALGRLTLADLALNPAREVVLSDGSAIRRAQDDDDKHDDVEDLALVLERLAGVERATRRLDESQVEDAANPSPSLASILGEVRSGAIRDAAVLAQQLDSLLTEQAAPAPLRSRTGYATDTGMVRDHNEDSLLAWDLRLIWDNKLTNVGLYIVADGMGGHEGGELASGIAINTIAQMLIPTLLDPQLQSGFVDINAIAERVNASVIQANLAIYEESVRRGNDMGTTLTMAVVIGDRAVVGNVGDSRTYLYRGDALSRVTKDHSLVQRLVDIGQISDEEAYSHPNRNAILRSLGDNGDLEVDLYEVRLGDGDHLMLCSDGLWEMVRDPAMAKIIAAHDSPPNACDELIKLANANGGEDNISCVLVRFNTPTAAARTAQ